MSTDFNVFELWKDFYNQSSNLLDEKITESFPSQGISQLLDMNLQFKKMIDETTERYLQLANVPSRKDIASVASQIVNLDAKVDSLEELLEEKQESSEIPAPLQLELTNLKSDLKNLDDKLNQILLLVNPKNKSNIIRSMRCVK